jgi:parallel beta-helix repeat protein
LMALIICAGSSYAFYQCNSCFNCSKTIDSASPGSTVYLTKDIYDVSDCINLEYIDNITFDCQGHRIDMITPNSGNGITVDDCYNVKIKNCVIANFTYGISIGSSEDTEVSGCYINNSVLSGIYVVISEGSIIKNNILMHNSDGIELTSSAYINVTNNTVINNHGKGMQFLSDSENNLVYANTFNNNSKGGIGLMDCSNNTISQNNLCYNGGLDISQWINASNNTGIENTCSTAGNWQDTGTTGGCANACHSTTTTSTFSSTTTTAGNTSSTTTTHVQCVLPGDYPPCGTISLGEVITHINEWAAGNATLGEVISLINAWATG